jgi:predicted amidophosphoribosyltransferase
VPGVAGVDYQGWSKELVHHLKVLGPRSVADFMANRIVDALVGVERVVGFENHVGTEGAVGARGHSLPARVYLVPVPSRKEMTRLRGFVPSVLLAKSLARGLSRIGVVARVKHVAQLSRSVKDQAGLNRQEREANLSGAMRSTGPLDEKNAMIWMVDDVVTTGASLRELQRSLKIAGWNVQRFVTFAETL